MKVALVITTVILLGLSLIRAPFPHEQPLQHGPTVVAILLLTIDARKNWLSTASFSCLIAFIWLHILGARFIYSFVPYDDWSITFFGSSMSEWFGWQRNHYDRLVHLCFGALCMVPSHDIATKYGQMRPRWAIIFALFAVMTMSAFYETMEWLLTVVMSPRHADAYNGQQGDFWDAQKDMALAFAGCLFTIPILVICGHKRRKTI